MRHKRILKHMLILLVFLSIGELYAQEKTVSGTITDGNGQPLPGANVLVSGTTTGTQSDFDGNYSIQANASDVLVFSYIGFMAQSISVGASNTIDVTLMEDAALLDEV